MITGYDDTYDSDNYDYDNGGYSDDSDKFYSRWSFAVFDSTSSEGVHVHGSHIHISNILVTLPSPPKMSCYNLPCLCLHLGGQWHQPQATDVHLKPISTSISSSQSVYGISLGGIFGQ